MRRNSPPTTTTTPRRPTTTTTTTTTRNLAVSATCQTTRMKTTIHNHNTTTAPFIFSFLLLLLSHEMMVVVVVAVEAAEEESVSGQHQAKVDSAQCSYTLVVNEFDVSKCPVMLADGQAAQDMVHQQQQQQQQHKYHHSKKGGSHDDPSSFSPSSSSSKPRGGPGNHELRGVGGWSSGGHRHQQDQEREVVGVLKSQVRDLEERLLQEMVMSRQLNSTLGRHDSALLQAEKRLADYQANFTTLYRAMVFVQRQLHRQRKVNKNLNKKLSNVMLDVVEVNNVLTRVPTSPRDGVKATAKTFHVQSVAKVRSCPGVTDQSPNFVDCAAVFSSGHRQSGVYYVRPHAAACPVPVWCDMDTPPGGWLLFQRRQDGSVPFKRDWDQYRDGFGSVDGEHWLGNDNLFLLTNQDHYQLRVDLWDFSGNRVHAVYTTFRVAGERDKFQLTVSDYSGSAQDSMYRHNKMAFSTPDRDNDGRRESHCAAEWEAGWWFNNCWFALLNGAYHNRSDVSYRGIAWNHWKREQLRKTEMKLRPVKIQP
ncbi:uncharacterized protein LOC143300366 [Babylonia areolata]|uniref:uncharacterized protein LOC143300366 n=1 Tax=Babylonia areolata TaxID=304850 RepID=UPI003FD29766